MYILLVRLYLVICTDFCIVQHPLSPVSIPTLRKRKPQETQALALASSQSWLPLLWPSIAIGWRLRLRLNGNRAWVELWLKKNLEKPSTLSYKKLKKYLGKTEGKSWKQRWVESMPCCLGQNLISHIKNTLSDGLSTLWKMPLKYLFSKCVHLHCTVRMNCSCKCVLILWLGEHWVVKLVSRRCEIPISDAGLYGPVPKHFKHIFGRWSIKWIVLINP